MLTNHSLKNGEIFDKDFRVMQRQFDRSPSKIETSPASAFWGTKDLLEGFEIQSTSNFIHINSHKLICTRPHFAFQQWFLAVKKVCQHWEITSFLKIAWERIRLQERNQDSHLIGIQIIVRCPKEQNRFRICGDVSWSTLFASTPPHFSSKEWCVALSRHLSIKEDR